MWFIHFLFTAGALICATRVAQSKNPVYAVMNLVLLFFNAAGLLLLQGMEFFAILLIIVYIGALSVMFLFVVMLLNISVTEIVLSQRATYYTIAQVLCFWCLGLFACLSTIWSPNSESLLMEVQHPGSSLQPALADVNSFYSANTDPWVYSLREGLLRQLSYLLYVQYIDLLIMASLILLVAMIGAVLLALKKLPNNVSNYQRDFRLIVCGVQDAQHFASTNTK